MHQFHSNARELSQHEANSKPQGSYGVFTSFGSFEEMLAFVEEARTMADSQVQEWQRQLQPGDYFVSYSPEIGLVIYNQIVSPEPDEPALLENYRLVRGYSVIVPEGELGEAHIVSAFGPLTQERFEHARAQGWPSTWEEFLVVVEDDQAWRQRLPSPRSENQ